MDLALFTAGGGSVSDVFVFGAVPEEVFDGVSFPAVVTNIILTHIRGMGSVLRANGVGDDGSEGVIIFWVLLSVLVGEKLGGGVVVDKSGNIDKVLSAPMFGRCWWSFLVQAILRGILLCILIWRTSFSKCCLEQSAVPLGNVCL